MSMIISDLPVADLVEVGDWRPSRFTPPLSEDFPTQADKLIPFVHRYWRDEDQGGEQPITLDPWQVWLLRHLLETYPDDWPEVELRGQLRFRQAVVSVGRQNGKSVLGAVLILYWLTKHLPGPKVLGMASGLGQADIVLKKVRYGIENEPALKASFRRMRQGVRRHQGSGYYQTLPARMERLQGEAASGALYDELHLGQSQLWSALVTAQSARRNTMLVGITTAGDDDSVLLQRLYAEGKAAIDGDDERFGFFVWEAEDQQLTEANVIRANPAVACGRVALSTKMADLTKEWAAPVDETGLTGKDRVIRYNLNRFVQGTAATWAPLDLWRDGAGDGLAELATTPWVVFGVHRHEWRYACLTATTKQNGRLFTEVIASLVDPSPEQLLAGCKALAGRPNAAFALDATKLATLARDLRARGVKVWSLTEGEQRQAAGVALSAIERGAVTHGNDALLSVQMPKAKRRDVGESWRISESQSSGNIEAVLATVWGLYVADTQPIPGMQMF